ncbi:vacuolar protein sorting-associated protein 33a-like protein [Dermatophagoides farinae]|uniref:procollagen-proline 4-dioxygenase n=2 Tax=Dermatophagoides farinae TaxID=6954 RepID=A0A9D4NQX4_DERFA|nr:vacuolar protein sorting-associated protein 33a-like protein [Dermatophagoides farinae]
MNQQNLIMDNDNHSIQLINQRQQQQQLDDCHQNFIRSSPNSNNNNNELLFNKIFAIIILCCCCLLIHQHDGVIPTVQCDIFSSTATIQSLMHLERHLVTSLTLYMENLEERSNQIKMYLSEFAYSAGQKRFAGTYADNLMDNPLQAFQLVKRLTINWNKIVKTVKKDDEWQQVDQLMNSYSMLLPKQEDLNGAALALIRLQDTYNLSLTDMADGYIMGKDSSIRLSARDCLYLGKNAFNNGYYGHSLEWFDEALVRAHQEGNRTASVDEIVPFYQLAIEYIDRLDNELREQNFPRHSDKLRVVEGDNEDYKRYQMLCRGEEFPMDKTELKRRTSDQRCYYSTNNGHPYLILKPLKVEQFNSEPFIAMYYDVISDKEIEIIKELSMPMLTRARVLTDDKDNEISTVRVSQTAWFTEANEPLIGQLNRRIESITGLSVNMNKSDCELVQIANYGIGGHYVPHYDYLIKDKPENQRTNISEKDQYAGDRIATFMFYLSDVEVGGSTVFTRLGIRVNPVKGAAIFWYNLLRNGEGIIDTIHGACPVLIGEKWVANYWIREHGQIFHRPCSLDPTK